MNPVLKTDWTTAAIREHMKTIIADPSQSSASSEATLAYMQFGGKAPKGFFSTKTIRKLKESFPSYMGDLLDKMGVCCFTEEMQNPLFWAHYAGTYTGMCVELEATGDASHPFRNCMKVNYTEHRPIVYASETGAFRTVYKEHNWGYIAQFGLCTKSIDWAVEREWRLWLPGRAGTYQALPENSLRSIFLGPFANSKIENSIYKLIRSSQTNIKLFRTRLSKTDFKVEIDKRVM